MPKLWIVCGETPSTPCPFMVTVILWFGLFLLGANVPIDENIRIGYIIFFRSLIEHKIIGFKTPYSKAEAWIWMVCEARFKDKSEQINFGSGERQIKTPRGSFTHSLRFMAKAWGWSTHKVIRYLSCLESDLMLTQKRTQQITQISICNYDTYQNTQTQQRTQQGNSKETARKQNKVMEEGNNGKYLLEREEIFKEELRPFLNNPYDKDVLLGFYEYWTEHNKSKTKLRFELEKTWDIKKRLSTWDRRGKMMRGINASNSRSKEDIEQSAKERLKRVFNIDDSEA